MFVVNLTIVDELGEVLNESYQVFNSLQTAVAFVESLAQFQPTREVDKRLANIRCELITIIEYIYCDSVSARCDS